jgi:transcriptional regulator with XRE-family HTH domain
MKDMKRSGPIPKTIQLASTLAARVYQLRELRNMTVRDLARSTRFGIRRIEDIQSGLETWLSSTDRQILAKALVVEPVLIEEVEVRSRVSKESQPTAVPNPVSEDLHGAIVQGARQLSCPLCGNKLNCSIQKGLDMDGFPVQLAKAHCTKCPFVLR